MPRIVGYTLCLALVGLILGTGRISRVELRSSLPWFASRIVGAGRKVERSPSKASSPSDLGRALRERDLGRAKILSQRARKRQQASSVLSGSNLSSATASSAAPTSTSTSNSSTIWTLDDTYEGQTFFDYFKFYSDGDPTNGLVEYVHQDEAFNSSMAYINHNNQVVMKVDNTTVLAPGQPRKSVRIGTTKTYTGGLFLLDLERGPYGCGVWPAWWTLGTGTWPYNGEIDIYEGVHLSSNNQMTFHSSENCTLVKDGSFSGFVNSTDCNCVNGNNGNQGCAVTDQSFSSSGATLKNIGGGIYAMTWDETGIRVWFFARAAIPNDITSFVPDPSQWGPPQAHLSPAQCDISKHFQDHSIIFDITFCGDWAGQTYLTSGCPGTCEDQITDPSNFDESIWIINSMRTYTNSRLQAGVLNGAPARVQRASFWGLFVGIIIAVILVCNV